MAKQQFQKTDIIRRVNKDKTISNLYIIGTRYNSPSIYKYMDLDVALNNLACGSIRFVEPLKWIDPYERRFYSANYSNLNYKQPKLLASCFSSGKTSEAAWKVYSSGKTGLASRCVQIVLDTNSLRKEINVSAQKIGYTLYEGQVNYNIGDSIINHLHCKNCWHNAIKANFDDSSFLSLLLLKRMAFDYEKEIRYFLMPTAKINVIPSEIDLKISWENIIKKIIVEKNFSSREETILSDYLRGACPNKFNRIVIEKTSLYNPLNRPIIFQP